MSVLSTLFRAFRLIHLLTEQPHKTVAELGKVLGIEGRNIRKYLTTLGELGYTIRSDKRGRYFIDLTETRTPSR